MKKLFLLIVISLFDTLLQSQEPGSYEDLIQRAETLLPMNPDGAAKLAADMLQQFPNKPRAYVILALGLMNTGRMHEADSIARIGLSLARQLNDKRSEGHLLGALGSLYHISAVFDSSIYYFQASLFPLKLSGDSVKYYKSLVNLALAWWKAGTPEKALDPLKAGEKYFIGIRDTTQSAVVGVNLASVLDELGQKEEAWEYFKRIEPLSMRLPPLTRSVFWQNYAVKLEDRGEVEGAYKYYGLAIELASAIKQQRNVLAAFVNRGVLEKNIGKTVEAEILLTKALDLIQKDSFYRDLEHDACSALSEVYEKRGKWQQAYLMQKRASELANRLYGPEKLRAFAEIEAKWKTEEQKRMLAEQKLALQRQRFLIWGLAVGFLAAMVLGTLLGFYAQERKRRLQVTQQNVAMLEAQNEELLALNQELIANLKAAGALNWKQAMIHLNDRDKSMIRLGDLLYVHAKAGGVEYVTRHGRVFNWQSLISCLEFLPAEVFTQVSRSAIVNLQEVSEVNDRKVVLSNSDVCTVGSTFQDALREQFVK